MLSYKKLCLEVFMAGVERKYSDEDILEQLRDHYKRNFKITRNSFEKDKTVCSSSIVY